MIRFPFEEMTQEFPHITLIRINEENIKVVFAIEKKQFFSKKL